MRARPIPVPVLCKYQYRPIATIIVQIILLSYMFSKQLNTHVPNTLLISVFLAPPLSGSTQCVFHLLTATRPVLFPNNQDLTFAPYNTHYPLLGEHLERAGLVPHVNAWDHPISLVGGDGGRGAWCFMSPDSFYKMDIPFKMEGATKVRSGKRA